MEQLVDMEIEIFNVDSTETNENSTPIFTVDKHFVLNCRKTCTQSHWTHYVSSLVRYGGLACIIILLPCTLAPGVTHCIINDAICGKYHFGSYKIFHKFDVAILIVMVKACLCLKIILLLSTFENFVLLTYVHISHICKILDIMYEACMSIYTTHMKPLASTMWPGMLYTDDKIANDASINNSFWLHFANRICSSKCLITNRY